MESTLRQVYLQSNRTEAIYFALREVFRFKILGTSLLIKMGKVVWLYERGAVKLLVALPPTLCSIISEVMRQRK